MSISASDHHRTTTRRQFLKTAAATMGSPAVVAGLPHVGRAEQPESLVAQITRSVVFQGRGGNQNWAWFHPRACMVPKPDGAEALMTLQTASGSDYFGEVHWTVSSDLGNAWSRPQPIPDLGRHPVREGLTVGVCDVVPQYHPRTNTVLAMGHNVYYQPGRLARPQGPRWPVYVVRDAQGNWSEHRQKLLWDDPRSTAIYTCGCSQRIILPGGDLLVALSLAPKGRSDRMVSTVRCAFDGRKLTIKSVGDALELRAGRGLLEPSLALLDGRYYMTIRAEDNHGYLSTSEDGLHWTPIRPWTWDDGTPLGMSTTQQHWVTHCDGLFLVYTRKTEENVNVFRWRAPLFVAEVDRQLLRLIRRTEQVVLPLIGDGIHDPNHVARMGNFHVTDASPDESWVTVGECLSHDNWHGDLLLARIRWTRPNRLVSFGDSLGNSLGDDREGGGIDPILLAQGNRLPSRCR